MKQEYRSEVRVESTINPDCKVKIKQKNQGESTINPDCTVKIKQKYQSEQAKSALNSQIENEVKVLNEKDKPPIDSDFVEFETKAKVLM